MTSPWGHPRGLCLFVLDEDNNDNNSDDNNNKDNDNNNDDDYDDTSNAMIDRYFWPTQFLETRARIFFRRIQDHSCWRNPRFELKLLFCLFNLDKGLLAWMKQRRNICVLITIQVTRTITLCHRLLNWAQSFRLASPQGLYRRFNLWIFCNPACLNNCGLMQNT